MARRELFLYSLRACRKILILHHAPHFSIEMLNSEARNPSRKICNNQVAIGKRHTAKHRRAHILLLQNRSVRRINRIETPI